MYINKKTKSPAIKYLLVFSVILLCLPVLDAEEESTYSGRAGELDMKVIQSTGGLVHAELIIFYHDPKINPAIPYLTMLNIFEPGSNRSSLLSTLKKLGNDFEVEHRPDFLSFKINFLPDKLGTFANFLKGLYSYKGFSLKRFEAGIQDYWKDFTKRKDWKKEAAFQVAYSRMFPGHLLGNSLIIPESMKNINLAQIRSFHQKTYKPTNSLLILKGELEPALAVGTIRRPLISLKSPEYKPQPSNPLKVNDKREVVIFHVPQNANPVIYWFEAIPALDKDDYINYRVFNDFLFGSPISRLTHSVLQNGVKVTGMDTQFVHHKDISILCNTVRLGYRDIEKFILLADGEKRRLRTRKIGRKEYLEVKNYFLGQLKVATRKYENAVEQERDRFLVNAGIFPLATTGLSQKVTLAGLNTIVPDTGRGKIIIVGNAGQILNNLSILKKGIIQFTIKQLPDTN